MSFSVPPGGGQALLEMAEVTRGKLTWEGAAVGGIVECTAFTHVEDLIAVFGRVVEPDGTAAGATGVEGCGTSGYPGDEDGLFTLYVPPGSCELVATKSRNMGKSIGPAVPIQAVRGVDVVDVVLVAPADPEWRDATPEETARTAEELCTYWLGRHAEMIALFEQMGSRQEPGSPGAEALAKRLREAKERREESRKTFCN